MPTEPTALSPAEFSEIVLGLSLYDVQAEVVEAVGQGMPTSMLASNGAGKTSRVLPALIYWFLNRYPKGWIPLTSGSWRQIQTQLMPALRLYAPLFPEWKYTQNGIVTDQGGQLIVFSTDNPGRAEGYHPKISKTEDPVLTIIDEAKTVPETINEAFSRCTRSMELICSTPGAPAGFFYRSHRKDARFYYRVHIKSEDCPHIDPRKIARDIDKYGREDPLVKSMHFAEFDEDSEAMILSASALTSALENPPPIDTMGEMVGFCDFAAGGDENTFTKRSGNKVRLIKAWRDRSPVQAVRTFIRLFQDNGLHPGEVYGDNGGLGCVMIDLFKEEGFPVIPVDNGFPAINKDNYTNVGSEIWYHGAREIKAGRVNISDDGNLDQELFQQLTDRLKVYDSKNRLRAESKDDMQARKVRSPDRADSFLGAIYVGSHLTGALTSEKIKSAATPQNPHAVERVRF